MYTLYNHAPNSDRIHPPPPHHRLSSQEELLLSTARSFVDAYFTKARALEGRMSWGAFVAEQQNNDSTVIMDNSTHRIDMHNATLASAAANPQASRLRGGRDGTGVLPSNVPIYVPSFFFVPRGTDAGADAVDNAVGVGVSAMNLPFNYIVGFLLDAVGSCTVEDATKAAGWVCWERKHCYSEWQMGPTCFRWLSNVGRCDSSLKGDDAAISNASITLRGSLSLPRHVFSDSECCVRFGGDWEGMTRCLHAAYGLQPAVSYRNIAGIDSVSIRWPQHADLSSHLLRLIRRNRILTVSMLDTYLIAIGVPPSPHFKSAFLASYSVSILQCGIRLNGERFQPSLFKLGSSGLCVDVSEGVSNAHFRKAYLADLGSLEGRVPSLFRSLSTSDYIPSETLALMAGADGAIADDVSPFTPKVESSHRGGTLAVSSRRRGGGSDEHGIKGGKKSDVPQTAGLRKRNTVSEDFVEESANVSNRDASDDAEFCTDSSDDDTDALELLFDGAADLNKQRETDFRCCFVSDTVNERPAVAEADTPLLSTLTVSAALIDAADAIEQHTGQRRDAHQLFFPTTDVGPNRHQTLPSTQPAPTLPTQAYLSNALQPIQQETIAPDIPLAGVVLTLITNDAVALRRVPLAYFFPHLAIVVREGLLRALGAKGDGNTPIDRADGRNMASGRACFIQKHRRASQILVGLQLLVSVADEQRRVRLHLQQSLHPPSSRRGVVGCCCVYNLEAVCCGKWKPLLPQPASLQGTSDIPSGSFAVQNSISNQNISATDDGNGAVGISRSPFSSSLRQLQLFSEMLFPSLSPDNTSALNAIVKSNTFVGNRSASPAYYCRLAVHISSSLKLDTTSPPQLSQLLVMLMGACWEPKKAEPSLSTLADITGEHGSRLCPKASGCDADADADVFLWCLHRSKPFYYCWSLICLELLERCLQKEEWCREEDSEEGQKPPLVGPTPAAVFEDAKSRVIRSMRTQRFLSSSAHTNAARTEACDSNVATSSAMRRVKRCRIEIDNHKDNDNERVVCDVEAAAIDDVDPLVLLIRGRLDDDDDGSESRDRSPSFVSDLFLPSDLFLHVERSTSAAATTASDKTASPHLQPLQTSEFIRFFPLSDSLTSPSSSSPAEVNPSASPLHGAWRKCLRAGADYMTSLSPQKKGSGTTVEAAATTVRRSEEIDRLTAPIGRSSHTKRRAQKTAREASADAVVGVVAAPLFAKDCTAAEDALNHFVRLFVKLLFHVQTVVKDSLSRLFSSTAAAIPTVMPSPSTHDTATAVAASPTFQREVSLLQWRYLHRLYVPSPFSSSPTISFETIASSSPFLPHRSRSPRVPSHSGAIPPLLKGSALAAHERRAVEWLALWGAVRHCLDRGTTMIAEEGAKEMRSKDAAHIVSSTPRADSSSPPSLTDSARTASACERAVLFILSARLLPDLLAIRRTIRRGWRLVQREAPREKGEAAEGAFTVTNENTKMARQTSSFQQEGGEKVHRSDEKERNDASTTPASAFPLPEDEEKEEIDLCFDDFSSAPSSLALAQSLVAGSNCHHNTTTTPSVKRSDADVFVQLARRLCFSDFTIPCSAIVVGVPTADSDHNYDRYSLAGDASSSSSPGGTMTARHLLASQHAKASSHDGRSNGSPNNSALTSLEEDIAAIQTRLDANEASFQAFRRRQCGAAAAGDGDADAIWKKKEKKAVGNADHANETSMNESMSLSLSPQPYPTVPLAPLLPFYNCSCVGGEVLLTLRLYYLRVAKLLAVLTEGAVTKVKRAMSTQSKGGGGDHGDSLKNGVGRAIHQQQSSKDNKTSANVISLAEQQQQHLQRLYQTHREHQRMLGVLRQSAAEAIVQRQRERFAAEEDEAEKGSRASEEVVVLKDGASGLPTSSPTSPPHHPLSPHTASALHGLYSPHLILLTFDTARMYIRQCIEMAMFLIEADNGTF